MAGMETLLRGVTNGSQIRSSEMKLDILATATVTVTFNHDS